MLLDDDIGQGREMSLKFYSPTSFSSPLLGPTLSFILSVWLLLLYHFLCHHPVSGSYSWSQFLPLVFCGFLFLISRRPGSCRSLTRILQKKKKKKKRNFAHNKRARRRPKRLFWQIGGEVHTLLSSVLVLQRPFLIFSDSGLFQLGKVAG